MKAITKRLRLLRVDRGISQRDTAIKADLPYGRYMDIENAYRTPNNSEVARIARALKASPADIVPSAEPEAAVAR